MDVDIARDAVAIAQAAASWLAARISEAVAARGSCSIAFSGGSTPEPMFVALARLPVPWNEVQVFQVDERIAPDGHPDRNANALVSALVTPAQIPAGNVHLMPVAEPDLAAAAANYARVLADVCGGTLDVVHLGLGTDGHTASWPPHHGVLEVTDRDVAIVAAFHGRDRMTLTVPAVNRARRIMFLVAGADKAGVLHRTIAHDRSLPAGRIREDDVMVFADRAAAERPPSEQGRQD